MAKNKNTNPENSIFTNPSIIQMFCGLARAYEIAKLGGFKLSVIHAADYDAAQDFQSIKDFYGSENFTKDGDLYVQIYAPDQGKTNKFSETLEDIHSRIETAKGNVKPTDFASSNACDALLKRAAQCFEFSLQQTTMVHKIAAVIGQLHASQLIAPEHIAEAIQFVCNRCNLYHGDVVVNAMAATIKFGQHIEIGLCEKTNEDIQKAIDYLKNLLPS